MTAGQAWFVAPGVPVATPAGDRGARIGCDIWFDRGGCRVSHAGDLVLAFDEVALDQSVGRRLVTAPGEFRHDLAYGIGVPNFVKRPGTPSARAELRARGRENLAADGRIDDPDLVLEDVTINGRPVLRVTPVGTVRRAQRRFEPFDAVKVS